MPKSQCANRRNCSPLIGPQSRETELQLKNNLASGPLTATPVLCLASGEEIPLDPVTIASNVSVSVWVNEGLLKHSPGTFSLDVNSPYEMVPDGVTDKGANTCSDTTRGLEEAPTDTKSQAIVCLNDVQ
jgi:hypothetical protein